MKAIFMSFKQFLIFTSQDFMLIVSCIAPLFLGLGIKNAIPLINDYLLQSYSLSLQPYYQLLDGFLCSITPVMYCYIAAMIILEERDYHLIPSLSVTPLGKLGYLISRIGFPSLFAFFITTLITSLFSLTSINFINILLMSFIATLQGIIVGLIIICFSSNKLEGIAVTKLASLFIVIIAVPVYIESHFQYILSLFSTFWFGHFLLEYQVINLMFSLIISIIWIFILLRIFDKKMNV